MSQPWETHYTGCTRRHPAVAYPRHACEECRAYERGLSAARDAVAALPHEDGCCSKGCACQTWEKPEPCDLSCNCSFWWMGHALAAIDALSE